MSPLLVLIVLSGYFVLLLIISYFTSKGADSETFFTGNRQSPWYLVAFGMIGASLSGVTFISVPGEVGSSQFTYFQMVLGYIPGYAFIALVLMPLYYRLNLVSIYGYLDKRLGFWSYKTGAFFFLLSRTIGSAFRLFLVAAVLQIGFFSAYGVPFWVTVAITIILIWLYTYKGGIKTIVWTDTLQTLFLLSSVVASIYLIGRELDVSFGELLTIVENSGYSRIFEWNWDSPRNFFKLFLSGALIAIVMTGMDQDMMQKNLTCRNINEAQKNMLWFTIVLVFVNLLFLGLGALLYIYSNAKGVPVPDRTDYLFPTLAIHHFNTFEGIIFMLGIIAAAYSSADSALTALTTSFCVDFLGLTSNKHISEGELVQAARGGQRGLTSNKHIPEDASTEQKNEMIDQAVRMRVHIGFSVVLFLVILVFQAINDESVINAVFKVAGYTYGPLLGMFSFGLSTKLSVKDKYVPVVCLLCPVLSYIIDVNSAVWFNGFQFGFFILMVNGALTYLGLLLISRRKM